MHSNQDTKYGAMAQCTAIVPKVALGEDVATFATTFA